MTNEQIDAIFAKFDDNGDGKMSKKEFKQLMLLSKKNPGAAGIGGAALSQSPAGSRTQSPAPSKRWDDQINLENIYVPLYVKQQWLIVKIWYLKMQGVFWTPPPPFTIKKIGQRANQRLS